MTEISFLDILFRLVVALALCAAIGYEREHRGKPAGLRTNMLVGLGTTMVTIASVEIARLSPNAAVDVSRIVSSILPGIGFIGAGNIIQARGSIHGLTTAASIWVVAAIGIVVGLGMYSLALIATVLALITLVVLPAPKEEENHFPKQ